MNIFTFEDYNIQLNKEEILLVKEFAELFSLKFNQGETGDKDGRKRLRAFKVFTYIYLVHDWKSPYSEFSPKEKHEAALEDSGIKDTEILKSPEVVAVVEKYLEMQDTRITKLLKSAYRAVDELRLFFTVVDLQERGEDGKFLAPAKDLMTNLAKLADMVESLQDLEIRVKKEQDSEKALRGQAEPGLFD